MELIQKVLIPFSIAIISTLVLLVIRKIAFNVLQKWAEKTDTRVDDIIILVIKTPSIYWCIAIGLYIGLAVSEVPDRYILYINKTIYIIIILSITFATAKLSGDIFAYFIKKADLPIPTTGLANGIVKGMIVIVGILIILNLLGISIAPLITALGIGGLAVALALQDTLSNLFAGIHILIERSLRVGDFIRLENGQEGYIEDITWRTTRIRMLPNNIVVIPNNKLAQSIVTNYYLPDKSMSILIPISVSYSSDPERVEQILLDEAKKAVKDVPGLLAEPGPLVRLIPGFEESSISFTLICCVREFGDQFLVQHELRKRIFKRFHQEGIDIPFPQMTVHIEENKENNL